MTVLLTLLLALGANPEAPRLQQARLQRGEEVKALFREAGVSYPPAELLLRVIKDEDVLELWAASRRGEAMRQIHAFPVCARSGVLGPKRQRGDGQVPEGFYFVDRFNPWSQFHLSLGIDYPNQKDRVRAGEEHPGGDIFIHGGCATIGCVPLQDGPMEVLFVIASDATHRRIPVHLFPTRLSEERIRALTEDEALRTFWRELLPGYLAFERTRRPPSVAVDPKTGAYRLRAPPPARVSGPAGPTARRARLR